jgi:DNA-binding NtrC family response regulator
MKSPGDAQASVLVVDSDVAVRDLLQEALRDEGFRVVTVYNMGMALLALRNFRFDCILADALGSPVAPDPWASLSEIRTAAGETPVVIFTAQVRQRFAGYAERGFAGYVAKPFSLDALNTLVLRVIHRDLPIQEGVASLGGRNSAAPSDFCHA